MTGAESMATAFATTARPRRFLRRVWPVTYTNAEEREEGRGRGKTHAGNGVGDRNGNAPTTGGGGDGRAIDGKVAKVKGSDRLKSHKQPITAAAPKEAEMESGGAGRGWVEGARSVGRGDTYTLPKRKGPRADSLLYGKFFVLSMSWERVCLWFLSPSLFHSRVGMPFFWYFRRADLRGERSCCLHLYNTSLCRELAQSFSRKLGSEGAISPQSATTTFFEQSPLW